ncbi:PREDICTED: ATP-binding cassette sub-family B member 5 [Gekko japonicus]|uniref:ATP-binding cassette sub-family B member 5 n=1 Tax=Gekko japonicus TaxID=146911 RepID=A0ABM1L6N8_GEKJA|nr:PREDICTED: ATP-binding cassette sub-family B member 5 [Gekko japonicus]
MTTFASYYVGLGFGVLILSTIQVWTFITSAARQTGRIRDKFFFAVLHQEMAWFDTIQIGTLNTRLTEDINTIQEGIGDKISLIVQFSSTFVAGIIIGFVHGWKLTLVILAVSPLLVLSGAVWSYLLSHLTIKELTAYAKAGAVAEEILSAIRTVTAFNGQKKATARYDANLEEARIVGMKKAIATNASLGITQFLIYACYALAFWYGTKLVEDEPNTYNIGTVLIVFFSVLIGVFSIGQASPNLESLANARGAAYEVYKIINKPRAIDSSSKEGFKPDKLQGKIEFKNVHFSYPSRPDTQILKGLNLKIQPGKTIAFVGSSGCGKSTTIQLLQRFYDPNEGKITIDRHDIRTLNIKWMRENIGIVSQEPTLFATTIAGNIRYGREDVTDAEIAEAAKEANAYDFISKLPDKFNTMVGERGAQLSGGQKQRIAIARALVRNPKILLLDEATSALDTQSESIVQTALDKAVMGVSTLIIANRGHVRMGRSGSAAPGFTLSTQSTRDARHPATTTVLPYPEVEKDPTPNKEEKLPEVPYSRILALNKPEFCVIAVGVIAAAIGGCVTPAFAILFGKIIGVYAKKESQTRVLLSLMFLLLGVISLVTYILQGFMFGRSGEALTMRLRSLSFKALLQQEIGWFDDHKNGIGVLLTRLATDASQVKGATGSRLGLSTMTIFTLLAAIIIAFVHGWQLTLLILACVPFVVIANAIRVRSMAGHALNDQKALEEAGRISTEAVENIRTVVALTREDRFFEQYKTSLESPYRDSLKKAPLNGFTYGISQCANFFINAAIFRFGAWLIAHCLINAEQFFIVFASVFFAAMHVGRSNSLAPDFGKSKVSAQRIFQLLDRKPLIDSYSEEGEKLEKFEGNIEFRDIHFVYPTRREVQVLQGLNIKVNKGQTLALVGSSGCGKSTSIQLLERFYDPVSGHVFIDGVDTKSLQIQWLRSQLGLVQQEPILFDCSIAENIQYGDNSRVVNQEEIEKAAKAANIHDFIQNLPEKYNTRVGDKGAQLSGGQKQRIAIARALVRKPAVLLLDEATSALDTESEKIVQKALDDARKGRTCIVIAHRLSTIQNADIIAVIQNGKVIEQGTHSQLLSMGGFYHTLVNAQVPH